MGEGEGGRVRSKTAEGIFSLTGTECSMVIVGTASTRTRNSGSRKRAAERDESNSVTKLRRC